MHAMHAMQEIGTQLAAFLAALLAASALHKALAARASVEAAGVLLGVPARLAAASVTAAAGSELLAAGLLMAAGSRRAGALLGALILGVYLVALARALAQGRRAIDCGCRFGSRSRSLGAYDLARNAGLIVLALGVAAAPVGALAPRHLLAALALLALYVALDTVMALEPHPGFSA